MKRVSHTLRCAAIVALLVLWTAPVLADIGPPLQVRLSGDPRPAEAGEFYEAAFEITVFEDGVLSGFSLSGKNWSSPALAAPATLTVARGQVQELNFSGIPDDPNEPLVLALEFNGRRSTWTFDLSLRYFEMIEQSNTTAEISGMPPPAKAPWYNQPPAGDRLNDMYLGTTPAPGAEAITITVRGWFGLARDTLLVGAPNLAIAVQDWRMTPYEPITLIGTGFTDDFGYYNIPCTFTPTPEDPYPDIVVTFNSYAYNGKVVMKGPGIDVDPYQWISDLLVDVTGTDVDLGQLVPGNEDQHGGLYVYTNVYRTWLYSYAKQFIDTPPVSVVWPDASTPRYNPPSETIFMSHGHSWREATHTHEYGHHWLWKNSWSESPEYCNGVCDEPKCAHCIWCWEQGSIAWTEGFPNFMADVIPRTYDWDYGTPAVNIFDFDSIRVCSDTTYHDPFYTEGFMAAVLHDISDANVGPDSHQVFGPWTDALALGADECFQVAHMLNPTSPGHFLQLFLGQYPQHKNNLWETAMNCGYQIDVAPPGIVTGITSPTHPLNVSTPNPYVILNWTHADDDAAGIAAYSIWTWSNHGLPDAMPETGAVESDTIGSLGPGTYYFSIRAQDRAGNWSDNYNWYGPVIVAPVTAVDLEFELRTGWAYEIVPRPDGNALSFFCPAPTTLIGNFPLTWTNVGYRNSGTTAATSFDIGLFVDGSHVTSENGVSVGGLSSGYLINWAQMTVPGGRHTLEVELDRGNHIHESDEHDNRLARQWVWSPYELQANVPVIRDAPPDRDGGWRWIPSHLTKWYNCDGLRFTSIGNWSVIAVWPMDDTANYDCRLFPASSSTTTGFDIPFDISAAPAGYLDLMVVNGLNMGHIDWDVGVVNGDEHFDSDYEIVHVTSGVLSVGDSLTVNFGTDEMVKVWDFSVGGGGPWPLSITLATDPHEPVSAWYFDETYTVGDPAVGTYDWATTFNSGWGQMFAPAAEAGHHGLVVYRHPKDGTGPISVTIEIQIAPPDFEHYIPAGWYRSITPRPAADGTPSYAPMPDTLYGNAASTYFNVSCENDGLTDAPFLNGTIDLDGVPGWWLAWGTFPSGGISIFNWTAPHMIRGGRHTLAFKLDPGEEIEEVHEHDNVWGEQYCWSPAEMAVGSIITRAVPPERMGGWNDITSGETRWFNCDGMRLPPRGISYWKALAVMPGASSNVDIRLHDPRAGVKTGFTGTITYSGWPTGESDYVLVNQNYTAESYDAGVLKISGEEDYTAHSAGALYHAWDGSETYGPYVMASGEIVHLHEFLFPTGPVELVLHNVDGSVDWGMTLHTFDEWFLSKSDAPDSCHSWLAGPGMSEALSAQIETNSYYCVAVWKRDSASLPAEGTYELYVGNSPTGVVDDAPPARTRLAAAYPNPFNPQTKIQFDLASEQRVTLEIFDIRGIRIRTLVNEVLPPARHTAVWNGRDDAGGMTASGVYFVRLTAGNVRNVKKLVLLK